MISGQIDFAALAKDAPPPFGELAASRSIDIPGLALRFDTQVACHSSGHTLLLISGSPRIRDPRLAQELKSRGWSAILPWLVSSPHEVLPHFAGRFSLLWLDLEKRSFGLVSDRFNTYGFCHAQQSGGLAFADRADAVPVPRRVEPQAVFDYLYFHAIPAPGTIFEGIRRLAPGACLQAGDGGVKISPWWSPRFEEPQYGDLKQLSESFRTLVSEAVSREAAEGEVGAFLSGGTDSSTVVGMLARQRGTPVKAYSIGFEAEGYDEMEYARITARHYGVEHHEYYVSPDDLVAGIARVATHYDQPFGNSSALPSYYCAKLAREQGITRLLAGDGGDELFGGNTRYAKQYIFAHYAKLPGVLRRGVLEPLLGIEALRGLPLLRKAASYVDQANTPLPDRTEQYNLLHRLGLSSVFASTYLDGIDAQAPMHLQREVWRAVEADTLINRMLGFDWRFTLADTDLPKVIGTTRLAGLDVAFPLLDDDLLEFSARLPPHFKLKGQQLRWFFKESLRQFLPPQILTKPKHGFGLPFGPWALKHPGLGKMAREALASFAARGVLREGFATHLFDTHLPAHPGYYGEMVWIVMMMEFWMREHAPDFRMTRA